VAVLEIMYLVPGGIVTFLLGRILWDKYKIAQYEQSVKRYLEALGCPSYDEEKVLNHYRQGSDPSRAAFWVDYRWKLKGPIFVLAGNYGEARGWALSQGLSRDQIIYINSVEKILGIRRGMRFVKVGRWHHKKWIDRILQELIIKAAIELNPEDLSVYEDK
jgi:hypothetical protein